MFLKNRRAQYGADGNGPKNKRPKDKLTPEDAEDFCDAITSKVRGEGAGKLESRYDPRCFLHI